MVVPAVRGDWRDDTVASQEMMFDGQHGQPMRIFQPCSCESMDCNRRHLDNLDIVIQSGNSCEFRRLSRSTNNYKSNHLIGDMIMAFFFERVWNSNLFRI